LFKEKKRGGGLHVLRELSQGRAKEERYRANPLWETVVCMV